MNIPESMLKYKSNRKLQQEILDAAEQINELHKQIKLKEGKFKYKCPSCNKFSKLKDTDAVQKHYYIEPHGCTGGDYWVTNGVEWFCPKCNTKLKPHYKESDDWQTMSYRFKSITDANER